MNRDYWAIYVLELILEKISYLLKFKAEVHLKLPDDHKLILIHYFLEL